MLKEYFPIISSAGLALGGLAFFAWCVVSGFRKRAKIAEQRLESSQADLVEVMRLEAQAWKNRYEGEHEEYVDYRKKTHEKANEDQKLIFKLTADCAELQSKTDITPILKFQERQVEINEKIAASLEARHKRHGPDA